MDFVDGGGLPWKAHEGREAATQVNGWIMNYLGRIIVFSCHAAENDRIQWQ